MSDDKGNCECHNWWRKVAIEIAIATAATVLAQVILRKWVFK